MCYFQYLDTYQLLEQNKNIMKEKIPIILQKVCAGFPSPATDYVEDEINLNEELIVNKASTFLIRVQGNSICLLYTSPSPRD